VRYVVLLRYGLRDLRSAVAVERLTDGSISCWEQRPPHAGVTWRFDGSAQSTSEGASSWSSYRLPLGDLGGPLVTFSVPGPRLLDPGVPAYDSALHRGATVQLDGEEILDHPHLVALQIVAVPHTQLPRHRETVGDRCIDRGRPDLWVVLNRLGTEPPDRVAAALGRHRWPPPLVLHAKRPFDSEPS
jgi:hypothetical protein